VPAAGAATGERPGAAAATAREPPGSAARAGWPRCAAAPAGAAATTAPVAIGGYFTITEVAAARQLFVSLDSVTPAAESAHASRK
jgi:hypothetical protein